MSRTRLEAVEAHAVGLHPGFSPLYRALFDLLPSLWRPYFGFRSIEQQNALYNQGRSLPGRIVTNAKGGESPHQYGCAVDLTICDYRGNFAWDHACWSQLEDACDKLGLRWGGGFRTIPDRPHVELLIRPTWKQIKEYLDLHGYDAAMAYIAKSTMP